MVLDVGRVGRKPIYMGYLGIGAICYFLLATAGTASVAVFVLLTGIILSFYGGGFATVPAYLKDLFGTIEVGAVHGRLLTAWSAAGIAGPLIVNGLADHETSVGKSGADLYTMSLLHHGRRPRRRLHRQPDDPAGRTTASTRPGARPARERALRPRRPAGDGPSTPTTTTHGRPVMSDMTMHGHDDAAGAKGSAALAIFLWVVVACALDLRPLQHVQPRSSTSSPGRSGSADPARRRAAGGTAAGPSRGRPVGCPRRHAPRVATSRRARRASDRRHAGSRMRTLRVPPPGSASARS